MEVDVWVGEPGEWLARPVAAVLAEVAEGTLDVNTEVRVSPGRRPTPLRRMLAQLVLAVQGEGRTPISFRDMFEESPLPIVQTDALGAIVAWSAAFATFLGAEGVDLTGESIGRFSLPDDREAELRQGNALLRGEIRAFTVEKRFVRLDGAVRESLTTIALVKGDGGSPVHMVGYIVDLTARNETERLLREAERLEGLWRLVRRVAHDFNNVLTVAELTAGELRAGHVSAEEASEVGADLAAAVELGRRLAQTLTDYGREPLGR